jgi:hypothetical protein
VVKRIADDHGFSLGVEGDVGRGATFRIGLGLLRQEALGFRPIDTEGGSAAGTPSDPSALVHAPSTIPPRP